MSDQHGEGVRMCRKRYDGVKGKRIGGSVPSAESSEKGRGGFFSEGLQRVVAGPGSKLLPIIIPSTQILKRHLLYVKI